MNFSAYRFGTLPGTVVGTRLPAVDNRKRFPRSSGCGLAMKPALNEKAPVFRGFF